MKLIKNLTVAAVATLVALTVVLAGDGYKKCTATTQECLDKMVEHMQKKGVIGLDGEWDDATGVYKITGFMEGSTARSAGVAIGDELIAMNGIKLNDETGSKNDAANRVPGKTAQITVRRAGAEKTMTVTLVKLSAEQIAKAVGQHMVEHSATKLAVAN
jgi:C-terminal processing protease CtpA/Prc